ncbi:hypothetical protein [Streptomyces xylophagus]|uniref:hypothetical protein n=1 Tax=Streptomyces xylophagus TaxID=285514 RepID=UPI00068A0672|nr:hypothetical protein [Streptomyces xylophagus]
MADERSAFPGDPESAGGSAAGRTPGRWLDRETAELLLRGGSLEAVDPAVRDQAERLAKTLGALSVEHPPGGAELPGEEAALAAFRAARTGNGVERAALGRRGRVQSSDAGLVRIGRPVPTAAGSRWGRPVRVGLTAVVAAGMLGGVAVAAATGVLPTPFLDDPTPAASISAAATPDRPLISPSPSGTGGSGTPTAGGGSGDSSGEAVGSGSGPTSSADAGDDKSVGSRGWWKGVTSSCRAVRDGKPLDSGRERTLEGVAGGTSHVWTYCKGLLQRGGAGTDDKGDTGTGSGTGTDKSGGGQGDEQNGGQGDQAGGQGASDDGQINPIAPGGGSSGGSGGDGGHQDNGAVATPAPSVFAPLARHGSSAAPSPAPTTETRGTPAPSPTYTAL